MKCDRCSGTGQIKRISEKTKKARNKPCPDCNGLGKKLISGVSDTKEIPDDGCTVVVRPEKQFGVEHIFNWRENKRVKAYIKTRIRGVEKVYDKEGKLLCVEDLQKMRIEMDERNKEQNDPEKMEEMEDLVVEDNYLVVDIEDMKVPRHKNRGKGFMYKLISNIKNNYVRYINTSWSSSSKDGREYLARQGFTRHGDALIWENPRHAKRIQAPESNA